MNCFVLAALGALAAGSACARSVERPRPHDVGAQSSAHGARTSTADGWVGLEDPLDARMVAPPPTGTQETPETALEPWNEPSFGERNALFTRLAGRTPHLWGEELAGVERDVDGAGPRLALTFDACDGRGYDAELTAWLASEHLAATLFVSGRFARRFPDVVRELARVPEFALENHGYDHRPCSVTGAAAFGLRGSRSLAEAAAEIERAADLLTSLGARHPRFYRAGTAHYDEVCAELARGLGYRIAGYRVAGDLGAGLPQAGVEQALLGAPDGAIILMHMGHPEGHTFEGLRAALPALRARGVRFVRLGEVP